MYDLPMAIGILISNEEITNTKLDETIIVGELSLDGKINKINGAFPITLEAFRCGMKKIILPKENAKEASIVQEIEVIRSRKSKRGNRLSKWYKKYSFR